MSTSAWPGRPGPQLKLLYSTSFVAGRYTIHESSVRKLPGLNTSQPS
eukprot:CAMPEP_0119425496 /NCGR_PEP_ID=MMETSP1335-20130426/34576_1 /TAXON_ID=259385 /ORGANISM="Chrysoculter rhomboideus, Strain RCC1486" /LENGTH=46 /DNA_ID= /DNA_START= /DNA_END= /DNA_ORIENTATION=